MYYTDRLVSIHYTDYLTPNALKNLYDKMTKLHLKIIPQFLEHIQSTQSTATLSLFVYLTEVQTDKSADKTQPRPFHTGSVFAAYICFYVSVCIVSDSVVPIFGMAGVVA